MIIDVQNLVKRYRELTALNHVDLQVQEGDILGLLGPNGSGKSTMINCILSLLSYDRGEIKVFDQTMKPDSYAIKERIGIVPQELAFFKELTVQENISYYCGLYLKDRAQVAKNVDQTIELVGLQDFTKFYPKQLSGGLARRLNIACGIAHQPELIFLDEPTVAVDPQSRNRILESIKELNKNGATIVYTTHYMEEVEFLCNRIVILDHGSVIAQGSADELKAMVKANEKIVITVPMITSEQQADLLKLPAVQELNYADQSLEITSGDLEQTMLPVLEYLQQAKVAYADLHTKEVTLNDVFLTITGRELRDEA
ncbi:ABC transporter ATP-binding protein [Xylocopilactobacillus apicola]|uniref:ABC transporter ATP-binding protein n=1 Tax=Xylocopilactobacillus apicola TaxID=2932184 RepID=A0AAU9DS51_9LACO|nr:ABC transporter ATP-binding protein [Xylocopilactobacillus apicola]BDR58043.1 ABC transporter ATP-binding protein [Xylocopilactobacillus apicola]